MVVSQGFLALPAPQSITPHPPHMKYYHRREARAAEMWHMGPAQGQDASPKRTAVDIPKESAGQELSREMKAFFSGKEFSLSTHKKPAALESLHM